MAKVILGPTIGMASGSVGAAVFSHNRYGTYIRRRATPTVSQTEAALAAKALMTSALRHGRTSRCCSSLHGICGPTRTL